MSRKTSVNNVKMRHEHTTRYTAPILVMHGRGIFLTAMHSRADDGWHLGPLLYLEPRRTLSLACKQEDKLCRVQAKFASAGDLGTSKRMTYSLFIFFSSLLKNNPISSNQKGKRETPKRKARRKERCTALKKTKRKNRHLICVTSKIVKYSHHQF